MSIRLLIADDSAVVRLGIGAMLAGSDVEVAYQVATGEEAVRCAVVCHPDVVILDVRMPGVDGLDALAQIKQQQPQIPVLLMSAAENVEEIARGYRLGACGFLSKASSRPAMLHVIHRAAIKKNAWCRSLLRRVRLMTPARGGSVIGGIWLTVRQQEILRRLALGQCNEEMAEELDISIETIRQHMKKILQKTGSEDRTQAALWAIRFGLG